MAYRIEFATSARRAFLELGLSDRQRIARRIDSLGRNPRPPGFAKLSGFQDLYRIRVGTYRIIYTIEDDRLIITILRVAHRRESCRGL
jgi:mRNA interferase RelE/StbE